MPLYHTADDKLISLSTAHVGGVLPPRTLRFKFSCAQDLKPFEEAFDPSQYLPEEYKDTCTWTKVNMRYDNSLGKASWIVWDLTFQAGHIADILNGSDADHPFKIIEGNLSGMTDASHLFENTHITKFSNVCGMTSITDASYMFSNDDELTQVSDLGMALVQSTSHMFYNCTTLTDAPSINTISCTNIDSMFEGCTNLSRVPNYLATNISSAKNAFKDTPSVLGGMVNMYNKLSANMPASRATGCFRNCGTGTTSGSTERASIPLAWGGGELPAMSVCIEVTDSDTGRASVLNTENATSITQLEDTTNLFLIVFGNRTAVNAFKDNTYLLDVAEANLDGIVTAEHMFDGCTNLKCIDKLDMSRIVATDYMFARCPSITTPHSMQLLSCSSAVKMFADCTSITAITLALSYNLTNTESMFAGCDALKTCIISLDENTGFRASHMFEYCSALETVTGMESAHILDASHMFRECTSLTVAPSFQIEGAQTLAHMFEMCSSLTSVSALFSGIPSLAASSTSFMFCDCTRLADIPSLPTENVTDMSAMFLNCSMLSEIPTLQMDSVSNVIEMFSGCINISSGVYEKYIELRDIQTITRYDGCFESCGLATEYGEATLKKISVDWGGMNVVPDYSLLVQFSEPIYPNSIPGMEDKWTEFDPVNEQWFVTCNATTSGGTTTYDCIGLLANITPDCYEYNQDTAYLSVIDSGYMYHVTSLCGMFANSHIGTICDMDTPEVSDVSRMFSNVVSHISVADTNAQTTRFYDTYREMSPVPEHSMAFYPSSLAGIPVEWGGTNYSARTIQIKISGATEGYLFDPTSYSGTHAISWRLQAAVHRASEPYEIWLATVEDTDWSHLLDGFGNLTEAQIEHGMTPDNRKIEIIAVSNLSTVSAVDYMLYNTTSFMSGVGELYEILKDSVSTHIMAFKNCNSPDVAALPYSWGGKYIEDMSLVVTVDAVSGRHQIETSSMFTNEFVGLSPDEATATYVITRNDPNWSGMLNGASGLLSVDDAGDTTQVTDTSEMFKSCSLLSSVHVFDTSSVTTMSGMFSDCAALTTIPKFAMENVELADRMFYHSGLIHTSDLMAINVSDASEMFSGCTALTSTGIVFSNDSITNTAGMFASCSSITSVPELFCHMENITNMEAMFLNCTSLKSIPAICTTSVTNMSNMFDCCTAVETGALALYQRASSTGNVQYHTDCFYVCGRNTDSGFLELLQIPSSWGGNLRPGMFVVSVEDSVEARNYMTSQSAYTAYQIRGTADKFTVIPESTTSYSNLFKDNIYLVEVIAADIPSTVKDTTQMFCNCRQLKQVAYFNTENVLDMEGMFNGCTNLESIPTLNMAKVINAAYMFGNCESLTELPVLDTSALEVMRGMFSGCTSLRTVPDINMEKVINVAYAFRNCTSIESGVFDLYEMACAHEKVTMTPSNYECCFENCGASTTIGARELSYIPTSWGGTLSSNTLIVAGRKGIEESSSYTASLVTGTTNIYKVVPASATSYNGLFAMNRYIYSVLSANIPSTVTTMVGMFVDCDLTHVGWFDTSHVTSMKHMFLKNRALMHIPTFDTSNVADMSEMISACERLTGIPDFNVKSVENMESMCEGCTNVESGALALYSKASTTGKVSSHENCFKNCGINTETGATELSCIPGDWGGTLASNTLVVKVTDSDEARAYMASQSNYTASLVPGTTDVFKVTPNSTTSYYELFLKNIYLLEVISANVPDTVTDMYEMFASCDKLTSVSQFDTQNVGRMSGMFRGCSRLKSVPLFDTKNVSRIDFMFYDCISLTSVPLFDTQNVMYMNDMFHRCYRVNSGALALYQRASATGKVTSYTDCFYNCGLNTSTGAVELACIPEDWGGTLSSNKLAVKVTDSDEARSYMASQSNYTASLIDGTTDTFIVTPKSTTSYTHLFMYNLYLVSLMSANIPDTVTSMTGMFSGCTSLVSVSSFNAKNVTDMRNMFETCTSLVSVPLFDTQNVTYMNSMFSHCTSLVSVPLFNTQNGTRMNSMFEYCTSLVLVPLFDTQNVTYMNSMFEDCINVKSGALALYQQAIATGNVQYHVGCFSNCGLNTSTGAAELECIPEDWGGTLASNTLVVKVTDSDEARAYMASQSNYTASLVPGTTDVFKVTPNSTTSYYELFLKNIYLLEVISANVPDTVTDMYAMFSDCTNLNYVSLFNTHNVTNMYMMFNKCSNLRSVPLFDMQNVTSAYAMFWACTTLSSVPLFNIPNVTDMEYMFGNCTNVESGALALYQRASATGKVTSYGFCFASCGINTETGAAELAQIPSSWGGTAA